MTDRTGGIPHLASREDAPRLKTLWRTVFGDDDADIEQFFNMFFDPNTTVIMDDSAAGSDETGPVSAAYIVPVGELVLPDGGGPDDAHPGGVASDGVCPGIRFSEKDRADRRYPCAMLYAIGTLPKFRGHGYGEAVTRVACEQAVKKGFRAVVLKPADSGLFEFYEERTDFRAFFEAYEAEYAAADFSADIQSAALSATAGRYALLPVSPAEYRCIRQNLLEGTAYIDMDERCLSYQQYLCRKSGGGLYALHRDGESIGCTSVAAGCAVIEREVGAVHIKELLLSDGCQVTDAVSAAARLLKAEKYIVRTLPEADEKRKFRFGMMAAIGGCTNVPYVYSAKWYGPAFD